MGAGWERGRSGDGESQEGVAKVQETGGKGLIMDRSTGTGRKNTPATEEQQSLVRKKENDLG